ncbi:MAG: ETC complex I subunit [Rhodospirillales bacterium]|nr:ETC complex I subunit [Rhodospirillales bacterium]
MPTPGSTDYSFPSGEPLTPARRAEQSESKVKVRIHRGTRSPMQAGKRQTHHWILEFEPESASEIEPLMGWTASADMRQQVTMSFQTRDEAIAFAQRKGWECAVWAPPCDHPAPQSYADNFRWPDELPPRPLSPDESPEEKESSWQHKRAM